MPDEEEKSCEQKAAEAEVEGFKERPWAFRCRGRSNKDGDGVHRRQGAQQSNHFR
jgi:hypothetical protein